MAVTAGVVGAGLIAAGTAAAVRAQRMKTKARAVQYGGSQEAGSSLAETYAKGADQGNAGYQQGNKGLNTAAANSQQLFRTGQGIIDQAQQPVVVDNLASQRLAGYQPGAISAQATRNTIDELGRQNLAGASAGGAAGIRDAVNANAQMGVQATGQLAQQAAQEKLGYLGMTIDQANADRAAALQAEAQRQSLLQTGAGIAAQGNNQRISSSGTLGQLGLADQGQFLAQQQNVLDTQNMNDLNYEQRRQADQQRKAQNLWGLGSSLIGGGASILGKAGG
jgi:hypothetical protein